MAHLLHLRKTMTRLLPVAVLLVGACGIARIEEDVCAHAAHHISQCSGEAVSIEANCDPEEAEQALAADCADLALRRTQATSFNPTLQACGFGKAPSYLGWACSDLAPTQLECGVSIYLDSCTPEQEDALAAATCAAVRMISEKYQLVQMAAEPGGDDAERQSLSLWFSQGQSDPSVILDNAVLRESIAKMGEHVLQDAPILQVRCQSVSQRIQCSKGPGRLAYYDPEDGSVGTCPLFYAPRQETLEQKNVASAVDLRAQTLIHELSHQLLGAKDVGYALYLGGCPVYCLYDPPTDADLKIGLAPQDLLVNADTYAGWFSGSASPACNVLPPVCNL